MRRPAPAHVFRFPAAAKRAAVATLTMGCVKGLPAVSREAVGCLAGWSSWSARKAHNLEVAGSSPAPATWCGVHVRDVRLGCIAISWTVRPLVESTAG